MLPLILKLSLEPVAELRNEADQVLYYITFFYNWLLQSLSDLGLP